MVTLQSESKPMVGILGGLGPLAGAWFYKRLVELTPATVDSEHLNIVLRSDPAIPSRINHIMGTGRSPAPALIRIARELVDAGATLLVIPSSTSHAYYDEVQQAVEQPIVNLPVEVASYVARHRLRRIGLLVTDATIHAGVYDRVASEVFLPVVGNEVVRARLQDVIASVKTGGDMAEARATLGELVHDPCWGGCDALLLGCSELVVLGLESSELVLVSVDDVLALAVLDAVTKAS